VGLTTVEIEYITGDIFEGDEEVLIHGANAKAAMGSGIAKTIRAKYPRCYQVYVKAHQDNGLDLGDIIWVDVGDRIIGNAITQENYGRDPDTVYVSYDAIEKVVKLIDDEFGDSENPPRIAFPLIGAGLANGSWKIISEIIEEFSTCFRPIVYLLDGVIPTT
jgi:O-acetyl-ADP-ribose deacetylase (regulator of RNase III)